MIYDLCLLVACAGYRVIYCVVSWSGALEWSIGVESNFGVAKDLAHG